MTGNDPPPPDGPTGTYPPGGNGGVPPEPPTDPYQSSEPDGPGDPLPGARFRPVSFHKKGGMGQVHRGHDVELNREIAFKEILPEYADRASVRRRFLFEAEVTGRLEHPGIVPVYGLGRDTAGRPYYAMRFIDGESLRDAVQAFHAPTGPTGADRALALRRLLTRFVAVCQTVAFAHSRGVIHRDLKPQNILLGPFGETLVMDWGIAKRVRAAAGELESAADLSGVPEPDPAAATRTRRGGTIGSPAYWAPEQANGRPDRHDERTDVYGLGAVLFEVLTGQPPHLDGRHAAQPPSPRAVRAWVDEVLDGVARRALALAPEDRFPSAAAVATEVERWLADQPVAAQRAAVAALARRAETHRDDLTLAEQLARQRANLGLMLGGMGRDADAADELAAAAATFSRLAKRRTEPRLQAEEANCYLALARSLAATGKAADAGAAERMAADIYRGLIATRPDEYKANYAAIMQTWAGEPPPPEEPAERAGSGVGVPDGHTGSLPPTPPPDAPSDGGLKTVPPPDRPDTPVRGFDPTDGYTPIQELGRGALGRVLLASDNALGRLVAIKIATAIRQTDQEYVNRRLFRELRITAALEHPNIARVYTHGRRASTGEPFIVMEYLPGEELSRKCLRLGPGWSAALLDPLAQVCDGLHYAHGRGVIHRDPKPTNIIVLPNGRAVLFDWGLAKVIGVPPGAAPPDAGEAASGPVPGDDKLSQDGAVMGTPAYMAPEQARGENRAVGPAADVFSIGAGLFHLVAGRPPVSPAGGAWEVLTRVRVGQYPRPRDVRPDVPRALDAICAKAMAFRPEDRYPTAAALAADIRAFLAGKPVSAAPPRTLWTWLTGR